MSAAPKASSSEKDDTKAESVKSPASARRGRPSVSRRIRNVLWSPAPPARESLDEAPEIPLARASFLSRLTFVWFSPIVSLGAKRPLSAGDLWALDDSRRAGFLADKFELAFEARKHSVEEHNERVRERGRKDGAAASMRRHLRRAWHGYTGLGRTPDGQRDIGMAMALSDTFRWDFWTAGLFKVVADVAQISLPLLMKQLIYFVQDAHYARQGVPGYTDPHVGKGVGLAIGLYLLQITFSICTHQMFARGAMVGVLARGTLIAAIYRRGLALTGKARTQGGLSNAKLLAFISAEVSRIDWAAQFAHLGWTAMLQILEVTIILLTNIGVSSLVGVAMVIMALPLQTWAMKKLFLFRRKASVWTDRRIRLVSEIFSGIRLIKLFAWERPYLKEVHQTRSTELVHIRKILTIRSANQALAMSIPLLASILVFLTYSLTGGEQDPARIWTTMSLLNLLRMPLMMAPNSFSTATDAWSAMQRLVPVFTAETRSEDLPIDKSLKSAVEVRDADFTWEQAGPPEPTVAKKSKKVGQGSDTPPERQEPSKLHDISMDVPRGALWLVVGAVGSGKSSLLQALIGEMRRTKGTLALGASIGYCSQQPWIRNATVRENILFGQAFDEQRYWRCVEACCLLPDLEMLPHGDLTEIGEKGITLSGGQRQRVSICRTLYYDADIILLDDPLSAVDAHVGAALMTRVILGELSSKTRILVTHHVQYLPHADHVIYLENGRIVEQGTYTDLLKSGSALAQLSSESGGNVQAKALEAGTKEDSDEGKTEVAAEEPKGDEKPKEKPSALMQAEERATGSLGWKIHWAFLKAGDGYVTGPLLFLTILLMQGSQIVAQFDLTWWQRDLWNRDEGFYLAIYGGLGVGVAIFTFALGVVATLVGTQSSKRLHRDALLRAIRAPMSFFDTTPIGRIMNRFGKDIDALDTRMNDALRLTIITFAQIGGAIVLIAIVEPYFLIAVAAILMGFFFLSKYYRASAREIKRLDNILRSSLYAHFSESMAGISTIRAFGEGKVFIRKNEEAIDHENRAYLLTTINQRWLSVRVDVMAASLTLVVALISVGRRYELNPSTAGLILSYILYVSQFMSMIIRQSAEFENNMSSVERLRHYATELEQEAPAHLAEAGLPDTWPSQGAIEFRDVVMSYRPGLPAVLKGISFSIRPGEKVGVVGRTGAGKSSMLLTLFRICELTSGSIIVDGVDISQIGLEDLRERLGIIPQEAVLFKGTLRSNIDPFGVHDDANLNSALRRAWLIDRGVDESGGGQSSRFTLDTPIEDDGGNLSVGERSLVGLARALVRDSKVLVLDEATASVDLTTDARIQRTIKEEFGDKTLITIAHRLKTIIGYDRVLVLDAGQLAAFDTPLALFDQGGLFHGLCSSSGITREDLIAASTDESPE